MRNYRDCVFGRGVKVRWKRRGCIVRDRDGEKREILRNIVPSLPLPPHNFQDGSPKFEGETCEEIKEVRLRGRERDFSIFQKLGLRPLSLASYPALEFLPVWMPSGAVRRDSSWLPLRALFSLAAQVPIPALPSRVRNVVLRSHRKG